MKEEVGVCKRDVHEQVHYALSCPLSLYIASPLSPPVTMTFPLPLFLPGRPYTDPQARTSFTPPRPP